MPEFQDEHVEEHKKIHEGMHRYEQYIKAVRAEPSTYSPAKFREVMASWSNVLFYHLDGTSQSDWPGSKVDLSFAC